jgi:anti-sigma factor RsiW
MIVRDQPPELSPEDEADLVAFVDGRLDSDGRARVEARADRDPDYKSALLRQQVGRDAVTAAAESTGAPLALKARVEEMGAARGRHKGEQRSGVRTRLGGLRWPAAGGIAAGSLAVILAVVMMIGGGPGIEDVAAAATRPPTAEVAPVPPTSKVLDERVADVRFPNYAGKFGWKAVGTRTDEIKGRATRTVFYEKDGKRIAYTVVSGDALDQPDAADRATVEGTVIRALRAEGREVVTWRRRGHTCVMTSKDVSRAQLLKLAGWKSWAGGERPG